MTLRRSDRSTSVSASLAGGLAVLLACGAVLLACGAESASSEGAPGERDGSGLPEAESGAPVAGGGVDPFSVCPPLLGTPEELALTPRADTELELLALTLDEGHVTATQATYERVVADVGALRARLPSVANLEYRGPHDGRSVNITFGERAMEALAAGTFTGWDCLLETYRAEVGPVVDLFPTYAPMLTLGGIFDVVRIAELFNQLPDIDATIYPNDRRSLCARREGEHYEYVVLRNNGRCDEPGCLGSARRVASDVPGEIVQVETWSAGSGTPIPDWVGAICN